MGPSIRISSPDEIRAVRAMAPGEPVIVMGYAFGHNDGSELTGTLHCQYDLRSVKIRLADGSGPYLVDRVSVRPS